MQPKRLQPNKENLMSDIVLKVSNVSKRFGGLQALSDVGIEIQRGQVYGLIGPNGAGKTTFFNVITGLYTPDSGSFELAGKPYTPTAVHDVAKAGIARTFQNIRLFAEMTAGMCARILVCSARCSAQQVSRPRKHKLQPAPKNCSITWALANSPITNPAPCLMVTSAA
jgi:ABC-type branched-subunit amino acid transport system ATPase component